MPESAREVDEKRLIQSAKQGNARAFGQLYELYLSPIYRYVYFRVNSAAEAEELTEDVFVSAWEALPTYKIRRNSSLLPWLYRIAHNLVVDYYRRRGLQKDTEPLFAVAEHPPSVEDLVGRKQEASRAIRALRGLGEVEQTVLLLRLVEQLSYQEIAAVVGKSEGACRVIQYRALASLRDLLTQEDVDE